MMKTIIFHRLDDSSYQDNQNNATLTVNNQSDVYRIVYFLLFSVESSRILFFISCISAFMSAICLIRPSDRLRREERLIKEIVAKKPINLLNSLREVRVGPPRFELEFLAPKAKRMDQATPRALL